MHDQLDRGWFQGIAIVRWLTWAWAVVGAVLSRRFMEEPELAALLLTSAGVFGAWATVMARRAPQRMASPSPLVAEVCLAVTLLMADSIVYSSGREQSLAWAWPAASIVSVAVVAGLRWALGVSFVMAAASLAGESGVRRGEDLGVAVLSKSALFVLAATAAATLAQRLRQAEREVAVARAREEMARELHDGVLQTLAVVQRRSTDHELATLARQQERELRDFLFGTRPGTDPLPVALRAAASRVALAHGIDPTIVLADDLPELAEPARAALVGAVGEALTNAAKHSTGTRIVVYAEPDEDGDGVVCTVRDDGQGFDWQGFDRLGSERANPQVGEGLRRSIHQRIVEQGGRVEIDSRPGRGTEIRMWIG